MNKADMSRIIFSCEECKYPERILLLTNLPADSAGAEKQKKKYQKTINGLSHELTLLKRMKVLDKLKYSAEEKHLIRIDSFF